MFGGLLDVNRNWRTPHITHCLGDCVDIQSRLMSGERFYDSNRNGCYDPEINTLYNDNNNDLLNPGTLRIFRNTALDSGFSL